MSPNYVQRLVSGVKRSGLVRRQKKCRPRPQRGLFESLEDRNLLATLTESGATLTITLDNTNEFFSIASAGSSYSLTSTNPFMDGGVTSGRVSPFGGTTASVTSAGLAAYDTIQIIDGSGVQGTKVTFDDSVAYAYSDNIVVDLSEDVTVASGELAVEFAGTSTFGSSNLTVTTTRPIEVGSNAHVLTTTGDISLEANAAGLSSGSFYSGIRMFSGSISSSGVGDIRLKGRGGDSGNSNYGVYISGNQTQVAGGTVGSAVIIDGTGGTGTSSNTYGVSLSSGSVTSAGGTIKVTGQGGGSLGNGHNYGVNIANGFQITAGGVGTIEIDGTGGNDTGGNNYGVLIDGTGTHVAAGGGDMHVTGRGGGLGTSARNTGVRIAQGSQVTAGGSGNVVIEGTGGDSEGLSNHGVEIGLNSVVASEGTGYVEVVGHAGGTGASTNNYGVSVGGQVTALGSGNVSVYGDGGAASGNSNMGVRIAGATAIVTSSGGNVIVTGLGGSGSGSGNSGISIASGGQVTSSGLGSVTVNGTGNSSKGADGIEINNSGSRITSSGGNVRVIGQGGRWEASSYGSGVSLGSSAEITAGGAGSVYVQGTGAGGKGPYNHGVVVSGSAIITSSAGDVEVQGFGGGAWFYSPYNYGVKISSGQITAGGNGTVTVHGVGGTGLNNYGVYVSGNQSINGQITSSGGSVTVTGEGAGDIPGGNNGTGILLEAHGRITAGGTGNVTVAGTGTNPGPYAGAGVQVGGANALITSNGGAVQVTGHVQGGAASPNTYGVYVLSGGQITGSGNASVSVNGTGGSGTGNQNLGVFVTGTSSTITSGGGNLQVTGQGGGSGTSSTNYGVFINTGGSIGASGAGTVFVEGTGGPGTGANNYGVLIEGADAAITSGGGSVQVVGTSGGGSSLSAIVVGNAGALYGGNISLAGNGMSFDGTSVINAGAGAVTLKPKASDGSVGVGLGSADAVGTLGLTDAELDRVTAGTLIIGDASSGAVTVVGPITRPASTNVQLASGANIVFNGGSVNTNGGSLLLAPIATGTVQPGTNGVDATASNTSFASGAVLQVNINGATVDTQYQQLNVVGAINLTGTQLLLTGTPALVGGETFTIVNNDGTDPIVGTFAGLPQGATIPNFLGSGLNATISYAGGPGNNDVTIKTIKPNTPPVAVADAFSTNQNTTLNIPAPGVLAGDSDADGDMLAVIKVSDPAHGTLTLNSNGSFVYTPTTDYFGTDQFTYKLTDGKAFSAPATVTLTVIPQANRAPSAMGDSYTTDEDTLLRVLAPGVLGNDSDLDGNLLTAQLITPPTHGTLALNPGTGYFTYQPYPNYHGSDSFTYKANDGHLDSDSVTVNLTVNSVNDVPVAVDDSYTMSVVDSFFTIEAAQLLANDFDLDNVAVPDSQTITAHLVVGGGPNHGYADIDDDGILSYIPEDGFTGTDTFTYHIFDGVAYSAPATVTITVTPKGGAAPQVESFIINDGSAQRSMVTSTTVTFNTEVTIDSGAFQIVNRTTSAPVTGWTTTTTVDSAGKTVVVFNFPSAAGFVGGSLADGNYRFTIAADKVHAGSFNLDGDGDGTDSDDFVFGAGDADKFFRFFGDTDGDRDVDGADLNQLKKSLNKQSGDPGYLWFLDYDSDGDVRKGGTGNQDDYAQFLQNFRKRNL